MFCSWGLETEKRKSVFAGTGWSRSVQGFPHRLLQGGDNVVVNFPCVGFCKVIVFLQSFSLLPNKKGTPAGSFFTMYQIIAAPKLAAAHCWKLVSWHSPTCGPYSFGGLGYLQKENPYSGVPLQGLACISLYFDPRFSMCVYHFQPISYSLNYFQDLMNCLYPF